MRFARTAANRSAQMPDPIQPFPPPLAPDAALLLDFDGTLVDLAETPDAIEVAASLPGLIARLGRRLDGRVAIVTGRSLSDLEAHLGSLAVPAAGSHGFELRLGGAGACEPPGGLAAAADELKVLSAADARLLAEEKPGSVALHFRRAPERAPEVEALAERLAAEHGLRVQHGKMVVELLPHGVDKGAAVRRIMAEPPFAGARPSFVGDDLTDEHAFVAAAARGGAGILVGPPRATAALWRLDDVAAVAAWLSNASGGLVA